MLFCHFVLIYLIYFYVCILSLNNYLSNVYLLSYFVKVKNSRITAAGYYVG